MPGPSLTPEHQVASWTQAPDVDDVQFSFYGFFFACTFRIISQKPLSDPRSQRFTQMCSSKRFIVLALT